MPFRSSQEPAGPRLSDLLSPGGLPTGIGSLPHTDPAPAVDAVLRHLPEIPFWPQLPRRSPLEGMVPQYVEGFPVGDDLRLPDAEEGVRGLERFYERVLAGDLEAFGLSPKRSPGFYALERRLVQDPPRDLRCVKAHVTGPVTLASSIKDPAGREALHDDGFRDALGQLAAQKALWQVRRLARLGKPVIVFLDEPVMEVYGSAYSSLSREMVLDLWRPTLEALESEDAWVGIHCCGNTDWGLLFESGAHIVNFDAFHFLEKMLLYPREAQAFLDRGGVIAWGIVPTSPEARDVTAEDLCRRLEEAMARFAQAGVDPEALRAGCLVTPSCGMGSLDEPLAEHILGLLEETSARFRAG
ncbi:MAG: methionine synthase [Candidatus Dadabacteria bacterium]|nr:MAG: methionine synthase [Candidatus Dadabacteria bacterium]